MGSILNTLKTILFVILGTGVALAAPVSSEDLKFKLAYETDCDPEVIVKSSATSTDSVIQPEYDPSCKGKSKKAHVAVFEDKTGKRYYVEISAARYQDMGQKDGALLNPTKTEYSTLLDVLINEAEAAIAYATTTAGYEQRVNAASSLTFAHENPTGDDRILMVGSMVKDVSPSVTGVTYNGVSMTQVGSLEAFQSNKGVVLFYLVAPATGSNNIVISSATTQDFIEGIGVMYTGVDQSSPIDVSGQQTTNAATINMTLTTTVDDAWMVGSHGSNRTQTAGTDTVLRSLDNDANLDYSDSDGSVGVAGSNTIQTTQSDTTVAGQVYAAIAPAGGAAPAAQPTPPVFLLGYNR